MSLRRCLLPCLLALGLAAPALAGPKFTSTWRAPEAAGKSFAGQKVVALVISDDENLRVSGEEALVRELAAVGVTQGVAAYRMIPKEELRSADTARGWVERSGAVGVVALRPVRASKEVVYTQSTWANPYYGSLWGYYGYGWGSLYDPGSVREDTILVIETLIFGVADGKLLWAGVSETTNPKDAGKVIKDLVNAAVKEMTKEGLIGRSPSRQPRQPGSLPRMAPTRRTENERMRDPTLALGLALAVAVAVCAPRGARAQSQSVRVVTVTVTVENLEPSTRGLTYRTLEGVRNSLTVNPDVTIYDELREGDLVVVHFIDAVVLKVKPGAKLTNPADTTAEAKAAVTDPTVKVEQQLTQVVTIDEIDVPGRAVVYHGADTRRVQRSVQDPALLGALARGDVVEITVTRERALSIERAPR